MDIISYRLVPKYYDDDIASTYMPLVARDIVVGVANFRLLSRQLTTTMKRFPACDSNDGSEERHC